jgi:hypothetical protein
MSSWRDQLAVRQDMLEGHVEEVVLTQVYGGPALTAGSFNPNYDIKTLDEAIQLCVDGKIGGFEIGGNGFNGIWYPIGRIRKWGDAEGIYQIKSIDGMGKEGSGFYDQIKSEFSLKMMTTLVHQATIPEKGLVNRRRIENGQEPLSAEECRAKFKAFAMIKRVTGLEETIDMFLRGKIRDFSFRWINEYNARRNIKVWAATRSICVEVCLDNHPVLVSDILVTDGEDIDEVRKRLNEQLQRSVDNYNQVWQLDAVLDSPHIEVWYTQQ